MSEVLLQPGDAAPDFTAVAVGAEYGDGRPVSLGGLKGRPVVLYFYPRDMTPGCTVQACALRDGWKGLAGRVHLFGVSRDTVASHRKFLAKEALPFPLLSDEDGALVQAYGVWVEKKLYGKVSMGVERSTFVIGTDGRLKAVLRKVKPAEHLDQLLAAL
jgi:peroxiredoxin Q/BCP